MGVQHEEENTENMSASSTGDMESEASNGSAEGGKPKLKLLIGIIPKRKRIATTTENS